MMDVIENFLNTSEYKLFKSLLDQCTEKEAGEAMYNDDKALKEGNS